MTPTHQCTVRSRLLHYVKQTLTLLPRKGFLCRNMPLFLRKVHLEEENDEEEGAELLYG